MHPEILGKKSLEEWNKSSKGLILPKFKKKKMQKGGLINPDEPSKTSPLYSYWKKFKQLPRDKQLAMEDNFRRSQGEEYIPFRPTEDWQVKAIQANKERQNILNEEANRLRSKIPGHQTYVTPKGDTLFSNSLSSGVIEQDYTPEMIASTFIGVPPIFKGTSTLAKVGNIGVDLISPFGKKGIEKNIEKDIFDETVQYIRKPEKIPGLYKRLAEGNITEEDIIVDEGLQFLYKNMLKETPFATPKDFINLYNSGEDVDKVLRNIEKGLREQKFKQKIPNLEFNAISGGKTMGMQSKVLPLGSFEGKTWYLDRALTEDIKDIDEVTGGFYGKLSNTKPFKVSSKRFKTPILNSIIPIGTGIGLSQKYKKK
jgi:hypothetical protein